MPNCIELEHKNSYIHIAKIQLNCPYIEFVGTAPKDKGISVSQFAEKYQTNVAINANFYQKDFTPVGLVVTQNRAWSNSRDYKFRVIFACDKQNRCSIEPRNRLTPINKNWQIAVSGWQSYNPNTKRFECAPNDQIGCSKKIINAHPRTVIGLDETRHLLYLIVVEGRQLTFSGLTLAELGELADELHLTSAINLDGGGSSSMVVNGKRISSLPFAQGQERAVSNHFGVRFKE